MPRKGGLASSRQAKQWEIIVFWEAGGNFAPERRPSIEPASKTVGNNSIVGGGGDVCPGKAD